MNTSSMHVRPSVWTLLLIFSSKVLALGAGGLHQYKVTDLCFRDDPKLDVCIRKKFNDLVEQYRKGDDEFGLYKLDPLHINKPLDFVDNLMLVGGHIAVQNMMTEGLSTINVLSLRSKLQNRTKMEFEFTAHFDNLISSGQYQFKGYLGRIPINADGRFTTTFKNVQITYVLKAALKEIGNRAYVQIESFQSKSPKFGETKVFASDLGSGSATLNRVALRFLNSYGTSISYELYPILGPVLDEVQKDICNDILSKHPFDVLLPPTRTKKSRRRPS